MYLKPEKIKERYMAMINEFLPYAVIKKKEIKNFIFKNSHEKISVSKGFEWDSKDFPVYFVTEIKAEIPEEYETVYLEIWTGGESLVIIDDFPYGEINPFHRDIDITKYADSSFHTVKLQTVPKKLFGEHQNHPCISYADIVYKDKYILKAYEMFRAAIEIMAATSDEALSQEIKNQLDKSISEIHIPRNTADYFSATHDNISLFSRVTGIWNPEKFKENRGLILSNEDRESILYSAANLDKFMKKITSEYPKKGKVNLIGHAHIDYAWLWPYEETKRKIARTFSNAVRMTEKYPDFKYSQSSAQMYKDIKENYPELYGRIKELIREGKWENSGGMWVESDCNIPSAESLIRQFYYGQNFFEKEFGIKNKTCWLPDVFGFSSLIPQILKEAEIENFVTIKINWNEKNKFPYDICKWRGIDGSEVLYFSFANPFDGYNGNTNPETLIKTWENHRDKDKVSETLLSFGYGDGGGGPSDDMLERYGFLSEWAGVPKLKIDTVDNFFKNINIKNELPVWDGELYLELHRGTFTTQAETKKLHKLAENKIYQAEFYSSVFSDFFEYPESETEKLWEILLHSEFHDVIPGSSIKEVYADAERELKYVCDESEKIIERILKKYGRKSENIISVINSTSYKRKIEFTAETGGRIIKDSEGNPFKIKRTGENEYIYEGNEIINPFESRIFNVSEEKEVFYKEEKKGNVIQNRRFILEVNYDGTFQVTDKLNGRKMFEERGNILFMYKDIPTRWDAWDIDHDYEKYAVSPEVKEIKKSEYSGEIIEVKYESEGSEIFQKYVLKENRIDIITELQWHSRRTMLRVKMPFNIHASHVKTDTSAGYNERSVYKNTDYEDAKFEVIGHRWADISEYGYGYALLNDCKYGYKFNHNEISLTLMRSPVYPDYFADEGNHRFTYSIFPHYGNDIMDVQREAEKLNNNLRTVFNYALNLNPFEISTEVLKVLAFKRGKENGFTLRIAETAGSSGKAKIKINRDFKKIYMANILENNKIELKTDGKSFELEYKPFKIYTFVIE